MNGKLREAYYYNINNFRATRILLREGNKLKLLKIERELIKGNVVLKNAFVIDKKNCFEKLG